jgi:hypothetical protein
MKVTWQKSDTGKSIFADVGEYHISITRNLLHGHYNPNDRFVKINKRNHDQDNTLSFFKEIPHAGNIKAAKQAALALIPELKQHAVIDNNHSL